MSDVSISLASETIGSIGMFEVRNTMLMAWLAMTRELYNACLEERKSAWTKQHARVTAFDQMRSLASVREVRPEFAAVPSVVQRGAIRRLDRAFQAFFRRCKTGEKPGYPRFRSRHRWNSLLVDDLGGKVPIVAGGRRVAVPLLGKVKFRQHRPIEGTPKAMRLTLRAGRWFVTFACADVPTKPLPPTDRDVGLDLGLTHFVATSDGDVVDVPMAEREARRELARAQRRVSRRKRGGGRRRAAVRLLARAHERVANVRRERHIVLARAPAPGNPPSSWDALEKAAEKAAQRGGLARVVGVARRTLGAARVDAPTG